MPRTFKSAFTLIEILVTLAIVAVLSTVVIVTLNPAELLKQARDSTRISDLNTVNTALGTFAADVVSAYVGSSSIVYVSLPDSSPTCANLTLPALPSGWVYNCATTDNYKKTDGTGWIPANLNRISFGNPLEKLPIDPKNSTSTGLYYTFVTTGSWWELTAILESDKYGPRMIVDGGVSENAFEQGTDLTLTPTEALDRGVPPDLTIPSIASISPTTATAGDPGFTLTVDGENFTSSSVVNWGASAKTTTFVSTAQLTATILAGDISATGTIAVTVYDPVKGTSGSSNFAISAPIVFVAGAWTTDSSGGPAQGLGSTITEVNGIIYMLAGGGTSFSSYNPTSKVWITLASTTAAAGRGSSLVKYNNDTIYAFRGEGNTTFWKYTIFTDTWIAVASTPSTVDHGASLAYPGTGDYIYASRGNNSSTFWRYSVSGDSWAISGVAEGVGASITEVDGKMYIFAGGSTNFRRYDPATQSWTNLASTTAAVSSGAALVKYNNDTIYAFQGSNTTAFWKYAISTDTWTAASSTPSAVYRGGSLVYPGTGDYIYASRGENSSTFWRYSIGGDSWSSLNNIPFPILGGSSLAVVGTNEIYTTIGQDQTHFAQYNISTGNWTSKTPVPGTITGISPLASDGTSVYALRGTATRNFYKYNPTANTWSTLASTTMDMGSLSYWEPRGGIVYSSSLGKFFAISGVSPGNLGSIISYNPSTDSWSNPGYSGRAIPFTILGGSSLAVVGTNNIYITIGQDQRQFAQYDIALGSWTSKALVPATVTGISPLASDGVSVYALRGTATKDFYKYNPGTDAWSTLATTTMNMGSVSYYEARGGMVYSQTHNSLFAIPGSGGYILKNTQ